MAFGASSGARASGADGSIVIGTSVDMYGMNQGLAKIEKSWKKLSKLTGGAIGVIGLVRFGKAALEAASDLQEVQNIVDVAFGEMAYKAENFANVAIEKFGMSRLAAKQTAGSFMAMGKSMGLTMDEASDMAISLAGLTADMSSFYNISQDYARVALSAVYTGETETLKRYGIVLTEANLQQFAQTKGIQTSVKAMDARSKAMLRYMYILEATKDMQGDFERTSGSWANQVRVLKQNWTEFLITVGRGLITVLNPVLQVLNAIIAAMIRLAKVIGMTLTRIFGIQWQSLSTGAEDTASSFSDAADSVDNFGDSVGGATKQVKKALAPYDELNVIAKDTASGGGGSGGGGGSDIDFDIPTPDYESALQEWIKGFDSLFELGRHISDSIETTLRNIDWDSIYEGARTFGTGLAEFLNGLITPGLFGAVGMTIASALNTAIYTALSFGQEFDFQNLGNSLASGVNEFFQTFDFGALADTIDAWVQGIYDTIVEFIKNVDWGGVFDGIVEFLSHIDLKTIAIFIEVLTLAGIGKLAFGIVPALIAKELAKAISTAWVAGGGLAGLGEAFALFAGGAGTLPEAMAAVFGGDSALMAGIFGIGTAIAGIATIIGGVVIAVNNFFDMWKNGLNWLNEALMLLGIALAAIGAIILGAPALVVAAIAGIVAAISTLAIIIKDNFGGQVAELIEPFVNTLKEKWEVIKSTVIEPLKESVGGLIESITRALTAFWEGVLKPVVEWIATDIVPPITAVVTAIVGFLMDLFASVTEIITGIIDIFRGIIDFLTGVFTGDWDLALQGISEILSGVFEIMAGVVTAIMSAISTTIQIALAFIAGIFTTVLGAIQTTVSIVFTTIKNIITTIINAIKTGISGALNAIQSGFTTTFNNIKTNVTNILTGLKNNIKGIINTILAFIERLANGVVRGINTVIDSLNGLQVGVPSWVTKLTGITSFGFAIPRLSEISIPRLAQGAVIPPNKEFMAILGDQKHGTNIETPLETMVQAFETALDSRGGGNNQPIVLQLNGRDIAQVVWDENEKRYKQTGFAY